MNDDIVIDVKNISKKYTIATDYQPDTLREKIVELAKYPFKVIKGEHQKPKTKEYWALKDVSFQVKRGEVLGIIGKNGAGKSTLLKILSRTTEPTSGTITMKGKVASLLEVGTGFNPELTGRENIYLNGAIIGMSRNEINSKFNEIVEFAGIGEFLDTPVKRYSSGMYVRLAFAVAAHLDSDILLLDEVLAVGDLEFQKKCLNKMSKLAKSGKTVIFISHNMDSIKKMCSKVICLANGVITGINDSSSEVIDRYMGKNVNEISDKWNSDNNYYKNKYFNPIKIYIKANINTHKHVIIRTSKNEVVIEGEIKVNDKDFCIGYALYNNSGECVYWSYTTDTTYPRNSLNKIGKVILSSFLPTQILNTGRYKLELIGGIHNKEWVFAPGDNNPSIDIEIVSKNEKTIMWVNRRPTTIAPALDWKVKYV